MVRAWQLLSMCMVSLEGIMHIRRAHYYTMRTRTPCAPVWPKVVCYVVTVSLLLTVTYYPPLMHQFGTSACVGMVTLAMLASGTDCAGPRVLMFNFIFNMTLMYQFFGVLGGGGKPKGPEGAKRL